MNNEALAHNVRGWVHYDNMAAALQKQIVNARKQRDSFEEQRTRDGNATLDLAC